MPLNPNLYSNTMGYAGFSVSTVRGGTFGGGMSTRRSRGFGFLAHNSLGIRI